MPATAQPNREQPERRLTVAQAAALLGTTERFPGGSLRNAASALPGSADTSAYQSPPWRNTSRPGPSSR